MLYIVAWNNSNSDDLLDYINYLREWLYLMTEKTGCDKFVGFLTDGRKNFRYKAAKTRPYKGNRKGKPRPKFLDEMKQHLVEHFGFIMDPNLEADDLCLMYANKLSKEGTAWIISSPDKDLRQLPGWFYNYRKDSFEKISKEQAEYNFYSSMLEGDSSDNIQGIPKVGAKTAIKILDAGIKEGKPLATIVAQEYIKAYGPMARMRYNEEHSLLFIWRDPSKFDFSTTVPQVAEHIEVITEITQNNDIPEIPDIEPVTEFYDNFDDEAPF